MDTTRALYKPPIHEHPLYPSARFVLHTCFACRRKGTIYGGYFCNEFRCLYKFHKECAEAPLEINHPSHPEHPLLLTSDEFQKPLSPYYVCPTCNFKLDFICGIKQYLPTIEHPTCHDHPLVFLKKLEEEDEDEDEDEEEDEKEEEEGEEEDDEEEEEKEEEEEDEEEEEVSCEICKESIDRPSYSCLECHMYFHVDCVHLSKEVNHPCHSTHPLIKVIASEPLAYYSKKICHFCSVPTEKVFYHCHLCDFTMCLLCTKHPPPLVIEQTKTHPHPLRLLMCKLKFTCKVCGIEGYDAMPYICIECGDFVVNGGCIDLPRVININRHDHRISLRQRLDRGHTNCGVCRENVSQYHGAYSCSVCPNYAVHSRCAVDMTTLHLRCAVDINVWDGRELEGIPEIFEDIAPFKVVGDNLINHFSHDKHNLRLHKDINNVFRGDKCIRCEACICPAGFDSIYSCEECNFVLHEKCANLPKKKKLVFDVTSYTLNNFIKVECCKLCGTLSGGFKYKANNLGTSYLYVDVHCGSISEPFLHDDAHLHALYIHANIALLWFCHACERRGDPGEYDRYMLRCVACNDFNLCLYCATLPEKIWHRSDDEHPLTLCRGRKSLRAKYFCEVCEMELDSTLWFFTCSTCGVNLHVRCVLGDFSRLKAESTFFIAAGKIFKVVHNNRNTRASCSQCHSRCKFSVILEYNNGYICSTSCLSRFYGKSYRYIMY